MLSLKQIYLRNIEKIKQLTDFLQNFQKTFAQTLSLAGILRTEIPTLLDQEEEQVVVLKEINEKEAKIVRLKEKLEELKERNQEL